MLHSEDDTVQAVFSSFADDPVMGELVELYVSEMPERIAALEEAFAAGDLGALQRLAHQMKGAAGSYGFDGLTSVARTLESSVKEGEPMEAVDSALQDLVGICRRVRAGAP